MRTSTSQLLILLLFLPLITYGQTHTWTGNGGNTDWFNALNWDANSVPSSTSNVLIPTGFDVEITTNPAMLDFMTIQAHATLEVNNSITITNGIDIMTDAHFLFKLGTLSGNATITNYGTFEITGWTQKFISQLVINNENLFFINDTGIIRAWDNMILNNNIGATVMVLGKGGALSTNTTGGTFNNYGLFNKVDIGEFGSFYLTLVTNNYGTMYVGKTQNILVLGPQQAINNMSTGIMTGEGAFDITAPFTNDGTIRPDGNQAAELKFVNTFTLSPQSIIELDIYGTQLNDYDKIKAFDNPFIDGNIEISLHYQPLINDTFTVITTTQGITGCSLPSSIYADYQGILYEFEPTCTFDKVNLKVIGQSQTHTFTGNGDGTSWADANNWNPLSVPLLTQAGNVIIPTGQTVTINAGTTVTFSFGAINGGGTIINNGTLNIKNFANSATNKIFSDITFYNNGTINSFREPGITNASAWRINDGAVFNNESTGEIIIDDIGIHYTTTNPGIIKNNGGKIKKTGSKDRVISGSFENNLGTIEVNDSELMFSPLTSNSISGGTFSVNANGVLKFANTSIFEGTLNGHIDGVLEITGNPTVNNTLINELTGNGLFFQFVDIEGTGEIINNSLIRIGSSGSKNIIGTQITNNAMFISCTVPGSDITFSQNAALNNTASGTIVINGCGFTSPSPGSASLTNAGLIQKLGTVIESVSLDITNSGKIEIYDGEWITSNGYTFNNTTDGEVMGVKLILPLYTYITNNGTFSPGIGVGTMSIINGFVQHPNGKLKIEINGLTSGSEHDVIEFSGDPPLDIAGTIEVVLGFAPLLNNEFVILTSNTTPNCSLPNTITSIFNGFEYTFDVICNTNSIILKVSSIDVLSLGDLVLSEQFIFSPNPTHGSLDIQFGSVFSEVDFTVSNVLGQTISHHTAQNTDSFQINLDCAAGLYFITAKTTTGETGIFKIIKR